MPNALLPTSPIPSMSISTYIPTITSELGPTQENHRTQAGLNLVFSALHRLSPGLAFWVATAAHSQTYSTQDRGVHMPSNTRIDTGLPGF